MRADYQDLLDRVAGYIIYILYDGKEYFANDNKNDIDLKDSHLIDRCEECGVKWKHGLRSFQNQKIHLKEHARMKLYHEEKGKGNLRNIANPDRYQPWKERYGGDYLDVRLEKHYHKQYHEVVKAEKRYLKNCTAKEKLIQKCSIIEDSLPADDSIFNQGIQESSSRINSERSPTVSRTSNIKRTPIADQNSKSKTALDLQIFTKQFDKKEPISNEEHALNVKANNEMESTKLSSTNFNRSEVAANMPFCFEERLRKNRDVKVVNYVDPWKESGADPEYRLLGPVIDIETNNPFLDICPLCEQPLNQDWEQHVKSCVLIFN